MIYEWLMDGQVRNFGDALYEITVEPKTLQVWREDKEHMHFPLGSVIDNTVIDETLRLGYKPIFYDCGWRGEKLDSTLVQQCTFLGARGPHTQRELAEHGVVVPVSLDAGYKVPKIVPKGVPNGMAISIRHILDDSDYSIDSALALGADALFTPTVEDRQDVLELIEKISGARFVLAGAMHVAIIAHAYDVPFALLDAGYINCPPKWEDWLASIEVTDVDWVDNVIDGRKWHKSSVLKGGDHGRQS